MKQQEVATFCRVKAEFIASSFTRCEVVWLCTFALEAGILATDKARQLMVDMQVYMAVAGNKSLNDLTRQIKIKFNLMKNMISNGTVVLHYLPTAAMAAEILTKLLTREKHKVNQLMLGIKSANSVGFEEECCSSRLEILYPDP